MRTSRTKRFTRSWRDWAVAMPSLFVLSVLVLYPLGTLLIQTFLPHIFDSQNALTPSLQPFLEALSDKLNFQSLANSLVIGLAASVVATVFGSISAFGAVRAPARIRILLDVLIWVTFFAPSYVIAQGWLQFMQDGGIAAQMFGLPNGWSAWFFTKGGLVFAMGLRYFPFVHIAMVQAVKNMGNGFEQAARSLGASRGRVFWRITLPLMAPGLLAGASIAFAEGFGDFGFSSAITPLTHIPLLTYQIYSALNEAPVNYAASAALSLILIFVMGTVLWLQMWWLKRGSYSTVSSSSTWNESANVPKVHWYSIASMVIAFFAVIIPVASMVVSSMWKTNINGLSSGNWTFAAYSQVLQIGGVGLNSIVRSIVYSVIAAIVTMGIALYVSFQLDRKKSPAMKFVNIVTMATIGIPGVVLAAGFIFAWNALWLVPIHLVLYGTPICLGMAYVAGSLPYAIRLDLGAISQLSPNLMRAAQVLGAPQRMVMWRIVLPLIGSTVVSTFFLTLTGIMFELPASALLYPPGQPPFPVTIQAKFNAFQWEQGSALATIGMIIVFLMYAIGRLVIRRMNFINSPSERPSETGNAAVGIQTISTMGD